MQLDGMARGFVFGAFALSLLQEGHPFHVPAPIGAAPRTCQRGVHVAPVGMCAAGTGQMGDSLPPQRKPDGSELLRRRPTGKESRGRGSPSSLPRAIQQPAEQLAASNEGSAMRSDAFDFGGELFDWGRGVEYTVPTPQFPKLVRQDAATRPRPARPEAARPYPPSGPRSRPQSDNVVAPPETVPGEEWLRFAPPSPLATGPPTGSGGDDTMPTLAELVGLPADATFSQLREAYRTAIKMAHPDVSLAEEGAPAAAGLSRAQLLNWAWARLQATEEAKLARGGASRQGRPRGSAPLLPPRAASVQAPRPAAGCKARAAPSGAAAASVQALRPEAGRKARAAPAGAAPRSSPRSAARPAPAGALTTGSSHSKLRRLQDLSKMTPDIGTADDGCTASC